MRSCDVLINNVLAGRLVEENAHLYSFTYDETYLASPTAVRIGIAFPLTQRSFSSPVLFPFFCNMLPEGKNRHFLCKAYHLSNDDDFGLLLKIATYDTIGAITVKER